LLGHSGVKEKSVNMELEIKRQMAHALGFFSIILIYIFGKWYAALLLFLVSTTFFILGEYRKNKDKYKIIKIKALDDFEDVIEDEFKTYERRKELPFRGAITFYFSCSLVIFLFEPNVAIASIAVLAFADSLSTVVGSFVGEHKLPINKKKSLEGSSIFFLTTITILLFFVNPLKALEISIAVTLVEMLPRVDDNLTVPLVTGVLMLLL
jgi:dolichol kinase